MCFFGLFRDSLWNTFLRNWRTLKGQVLGPIPFGSIFGHHLAVETWWSEEVAQYRSTQRAYLTNCLQPATKTSLPGTMMSPLRLKMMVRTRQCCMVLLLMVPLVPLLPFLVQCRKTLSFKHSVKRKLICSRVQSKRSILLFCSKHANSHLLQLGIQSSCRSQISDTQCAEEQLLGKHVNTSARPNEGPTNTQRWTGCKIWTAAGPSGRPHAWAMQIFIETTRRPLWNLRMRVLERSCCLYSHWRAPLRTELLFEQLCCFSPPPWVVPV